MILNVKDRHVDRVAIVDDDQDARDTWSGLVNAEFATNPLSGPFANLRTLVDTIVGGANAALCDHHLKEGNYAHCSGAEAVCALYRQQFPAVLVTRYSKADMDEIRLYRRGIPVLLASDMADPVSIAAGFDLCMGEFDEKYAPHRRPWKTLVRIEDVESGGRNPVVFAVLPGWNSSEVVKFPLTLIPEELRRYVEKGAHFFAMVNKGAEDQAELYFENFEFRGK